MIRVRPTQPRSRRFHFFSIPSLLLLVRTLAPEALTATAESPFGFTPSKEQWLLAPSAITIPTHGLATTQTQVPTRSMSAIGGVQSDAVTMTTISHQDPRPRKVIL
jgi:hypothetical protein